ncbi:putative protein TPRXL [Cyclospora cayetanensis]|uniref:SAG family member n=1 Tax=Cyclospora cayetanensis TaxID=88456 RepID=A0A6P6RYK7_9EIME|nr:putative protein TPRXL [Cyclospora cayetanensis]
MVRLAFIAVGIAALLRGQGTCASTGQNGPQTNDVRHVVGISATAGALNCLSDMNEPRTAAGLSELKAPAASTEQTKVANALGKEGKTETTKYLQDLCTDLIAVRPVTVAVFAPLHVNTNSQTNPPKTTTKGTVAYHVQTGSEGSCSAAVDYWKSGFSLFNNQLPPSYSSSSPSDIYKNGQAVSFVALYNPKPGPTAECAFVKCPATTNTTPSTPPSSSGGSQTPNSQGVSNGLSSPQNQSQEEKNPVSSAAAAGHSVEPSSNEQNSPSDDANQARVIRLAGASGSNAQESDSKTVNAVVCLVSPPALEDGKAPFTEQIWAQISDSIINGTSKASPASLLMLAAVSASALIFY